LRLEHVSANASASRREVTVAAAQQADFAIREDLSEYAGSWVAIRDGKLVASALDPVELRDMPDVRHDDMLIPVPDHIGDNCIL
jgi:hypothetical protein